MSDLSETLDLVYATMEGSEVAERYSERHSITSQAVLTVTDDETAGLLALHLAPKIEGKTVVEIGGGIGLLACHMGHLAKRVYCIEANPAWTWAFVGCLYQNKPRNVSFLFGSANEFVGVIKADVALFCTHSGVDAMRLVAAQFAPVVIDVYGEMIAHNPDGFDVFAREARKWA